MASEKEYWRVPLIQYCLDVVIMFNCDLTLLYIRCRKHIWVNVIRITKVLIDVFVRKLKNVFKTQKSHLQQLPVYMHFSIAGICVNYFWPMGVVNKNKGIIRKKRLHYYVKRSNYLSCEYFNVFTMFGIKI